MCQGRGCACVLFHVAGGAVAGSNAAAVALLAAAEVQEEPWTQLQGIAEVLEVMEAAVSQNIYLPQLMLYRCARDHQQLAR